MVFFKNNFAENIGVYVQREKREYRKMHNTLDTTVTLDCGISSIHLFVKGKYMYALWLGRLILLIPGFIINKVYLVLIE